MNQNTAAPSPQPKEAGRPPMPPRGRSRNRRLRSVALLLLAVTAASCSAATGSDDVARPARPVTVYGFESTIHTDGDAVAAGKMDLAVIAAKVADENGELVVYRFGGAPDEMSAPASVTLIPKGDNDMFRQNSKQTMLEAVSPQLASVLDTAGVAADADVFGSLNTFAGALAERSGGRSDDGVSRRLVVRSRFAHRTGWADLTNMELDDAKIADVMSWIKDRRLMPDLSAADVVLVGVGRGEDSGVSAARAAQYRQLMAAWCAEARARSCVISTDLGPL